MLAALKEMIEALKKAQKDLDGKKPPPGMSEAGQPEDPPLVDILAELKMIRALQMRVNTRTARYAKLIERRTGRQRRDRRGPQAAGPASGADLPRHPRPADGEEPMRRAISHGTQWSLGRPWCWPHRCRRGPSRWAASGSAHLAAARGSEGQGRRVRLARCEKDRCGHPDKGRNAVVRRACAGGRGRTAPARGADLRAGRRQRGEAGGAMLRAAPPVAAARARLGFESRAVPPLLAANLRLLYARWLVHESLFDEAQEQLAGLTPARSGGPRLAAVLPKRGRSRLAE